MIWTKFWVWKWADDYVAKPVRPRVLLARVRALLRRNAAPLEEQEEEVCNRLTFGPLVVDTPCAKPG